MSIDYANDGWEMCQNIFFVHFTTQDIKQKPAHVKLLWAANSSLVTCPYYPQFTCPIGSNMFRASQGLHLPVHICGHLHWADSGMTIPRRKSKERSCCSYFWRPKCPLKYTAHWLTDWLRKKITAQIEESVDWGVSEWWFEFQAAALILI